MKPGWGSSSHLAGPQDLGLGQTPLNLVGSLLLFVLSGGGAARLGPCHPHLLSGPACPQFPLKEGLPDEEKGKEEEMEEEDSSFKVCVPGIVTLQSPLHKTFRSTDTVGKCGAQPALLRPRGLHSGPDS